jgi:WD40 repeat protein
MTNSGEPEAVRVAPAVVVRGHKALVLAVAWSPDGRRLASGSLDGTVRLWDGRTRAEARLLEGYTVQTFSLAFSPDSRVLAAGCSDRAVRLWDPDQGELLAVLIGHEDVVHGLSFSPDGRWLASCSPDRTVRVWETRSRAEAAVLTGHGHFVRDAAFSPDGRWLASCSEDGRARLWSVQDWSLDVEARLEGEAALSLAWVDGGRLLAVGGGRGAVGLYDAEAGEWLKPLAGHTGAVTGLAFSPALGLMASFGRDDRLRLWRARQQEPAAVIEEAHSGFLATRPAWHPWEPLLAVPGRAGTIIHLWAVEATREGGRG